MTTPDFWTRLAAPFPVEETEKKPQPVGREGEKAHCVRGSNVSADGYFCGGWHARSVHLDYIGHAGLTMRLNDVCGPGGWDWQPLATTEQGTPLWTDGGMWIRLTIIDPDGVAVTKLGFGDQGFTKGANGVKECIGDALRNAAMRFGIATYLWSKSDRAKAKGETAEPPAVEPPSVEAQFVRWLTDETPGWTPDQRRDTVTSALVTMGVGNLTEASEVQWQTIWDLWRQTGVPMPERTTR
jgi:hypothetical protein